MKIALVGQPNSGKSTLFNSVAGYRSMTANFPGATVHYTRSRVYLNGSVAELIDLPGTYSLTTSNPTEAATRDFLHSEEIDLVINVVDASVLCRSLELTLQLMDLGMPLIVCLNMMDEAHRKGIQIEDRKLSQILNLPVATTIAAEGIGIFELFNKALQLSRSPLLTNPGIPFHRDTESVIDEMSRHLESSDVRTHSIAPRLLAIKLLEGDDYYVSHAGQDTLQLIAAARQKLAESRGKPADEVIESERHALSLQVFE